MSEQSKTQALADAIRRAEQENPNAALASSFVPVVGQLTGAASTAASMVSDEAGLAEKILAAAAMVPGGRLLKKTGAQGKLDDFLDGVDLDKFWEKWHWGGAPESAGDRKGLLEEYWKRKHGTDFPEGDFADEINAGG